MDKHLSFIIHMSTRHLGTLLLPQNVALLHWPNLCGQKYLEELDLLQQEK